MSTEKRLQNLYVARLVTNEKPCFVCNKFTNAVLTSADGSNADWFYICRSHLGDFNFCSKLGGASPKTAARQQQSQEKKESSLADRPPESDSLTELVSSIGSAWKSWRGSSKKPEDKKEEDKKKEEKEEDKSKEEKKDDTSSAMSSPTSPSSSASLPASPSSLSSPQQPVRFVIQRDYFYLRQREYLKKLQKKEAAEKLKTLQFPEVPKTMPLNKNNATQN